MKVTALNEFHQERGGKMVPFAGYSMPVQYKDGIIAEHKWVRTSAGLFDISHMGQILVLGKHRGKKLEKIFPSYLKKLPFGKQQYSCLLNKYDGIIDDVMITNMGYYHIIVSNGCSKDDVYKVLNESEIDFVELRTFHSLLAVQGPKACEVLERVFQKPDRIVEGIASMNFMTAKNLWVTLNGYSVCCLVSRSGYTGEDGFEISVLDNYVEDLAAKILTNTEVKLIGLGARDSLRLEAGLPLYGSDLSQNITPSEAGLNWILRSEKVTHPIKRRVGFIPESRAPIRHGAKILLGDFVVGEVSSGGFSPILNHPIAMGYIKSEYLDDDFDFHVVLRDKKIPIELVEMPFVEKRYFQ